VTRSPATIRSCLPYVLILFATLLLAGCSGGLSQAGSNPDPGGGPPAPSPPPNPPPTSPQSGSLTSIEHIVFFMQENHSFDSYFGHLGDYRVQHGFNDSFDGLPLDAALPDPNGDLVKSFHEQSVCVENARTIWNAAHLSVDGGKMDDFVKVVSTWSVSSYDPEGTRAMGYYDWTDLPYYYELATQFATSDRYFASVLTLTIPNRMYLFSGTSFGHIIDDTAPLGGWTQRTIFDELDQANISWRYYVQDSTLYLSQWAAYAQNKDHISNISNWYTDVQHPDTLPNVIFIERAGATGLDEHPPNNIQKGAANTKKILDALMQSPSWGSSAFIFTFDEGDGLYDHVPPAALPAPDDIPPMLKPGDEPGNFNESGQRVPFIMVSPWVRPHYVSHVIRDHTSILKLIETRFSLPALTKRDAAADDMTELFDFSQAHLATPPVLPDQPMNGLCSISREKAPGF